MIKMKIAIIALVMICSQSMFSQSKTVKGSVKDASGELLPGVSILIKGTQRGTETDFDGLFTLNNVDSRPVSSWLKLCIQSR